MPATLEVALGSLRARKRLVVHIHGYAARVAAMRVIPVGCMSEAQCTTVYASLVHFGRDGLMHSTTLPGKAARKAKGPTTTGCGVSARRPQDVVVLLTLVNVRVQFGPIGGRPRFRLGRRDCSLEGHASLAYGRFMHELHKMHNRRPLLLDASR